MKNKFQFFLVSNYRDLRYFERANPNAEISVWSRRRNQIERNPPSGASPNGALDEDDPFSQCRPLFRPAGCKDGPAVQLSDLTQTRDTQLN